MTVAGVLMGACQVWDGALWVLRSLVWTLPEIGVLVQGDAGVRAKAMSNHISAGYVDNLLLTSMA